MKTLYCLCFTLLTCSTSSFSQTLQVIKGVTLIDGTGKEPKQNVSLVIKDDIIHAVLSSNASFPKDATIVDYSGKFVMPGMINGHCHLGLLKGDNASPANYSYENILRQLEKYERYGISRVLCLGTDQQIIFALRDSSQKGLFPGATIYTAGYGFTANNAPPTNLSHSILQPQTV